MKETAADALRGWRRVVVDTYVIEWMERSSRQLCFKARFLKDRSGDDVAQAVYLVFLIKPYLLHRYVALGEGAELRKEVFKYCWTIANYHIKKAHKSANVERKAIQSIAQYKGGVQYNESDDRAAIVKVSDWVSKRNKVDQDIIRGTVHGFSLDEFEAATGLKHTAIYERRRKLEQEYKSPPSSHTADRDRSYFRV